MVSINKDSDLHSILKTMVNLKRDLYDIIADLKIIYQSQINFFSNEIPEKDTLYKNYDLIKNININYTLENSIYIVTNGDYVPFIMVNIPTNLYKTIVLSYLCPFSVPEYEVTVFNSAKMYMFVKGNLKGIYEIPAHDVALFVGAFSKENLISFSKERKSYLNCIP